jgi:hypothetical protein
MGKWGNRQAGPPSADAKSASFPETLGRYQIVAEIGETPGRLFCATDSERDRTVALKILGNDLTPETLAACERDFYALAALAHPNLVQLYELDHDGPVWFYTMEAVRGCDPISYIRTGIVEDDLWPDVVIGPARPQKTPLFSTTQYGRLREVLSQVASGLVALHRGGRVHGDLRPENIQVTREGRAVVTGVGLRRLGRAPSSTDAQALCTAAYMAPEQAKGDALGPAMDWYSFGVFIYEAISGVWPFEGPPIRMLVQKQTTEPPRLPEMQPDAPADLTALCQALLQVNPNDRPTADDIMNVLGGRLSAVGDDLDSPHTHPFVGRHTEIGHLEQAFGEAHGRRPLTMVLRGAPGAGKTELAEKFLDRVDSDFADVLILRGRCREREQVPYKALTSIVSDIATRLRRMNPSDAAGFLPEDAPLLARLFPVLRRLPLVTRMPSQATGNQDVRELRARTFAAFAELIRRLTRRWRVVLFIDDFQWADGDSLALINQMLGAAETRGFMLLVSVRADQSGEVPPRVARLLAAMDQVRVLHVQALPREEATHLAHLLHRRITGKHASALLAQSVAADSGGYPLIIDELMRYIADVREELPVRREDALWARIERLDSDTRALLEVVSVGGCPMRLETAAVAAGLGGKDWSRSATRLRLSHFARTTGGRANDTIEIHHEEVRDVVLGRLHESRRIALHQRIAEELEAEGAIHPDPHLVLSHFEAAGDRKRATELALQAANRAREAMAFEAAAALYRTILQFDHAEDRLAIERELCAVLTHAGRRTEAAQAYVDLARKQTLPMAAESRRRAAIELFRGGQIGRAVAALDALLSHGKASRLSRWPARQRWRMSLGLRRLSVSENELSPAELIWHDVHASRAAALAVIADTRATACLERVLGSALRLGETQRVVASLVMAILDRAARTGWNRGVASWVEEARRLTEATAAVELLSWRRLLDGAESRAAGRFKHAAELLATEPRPDRDVFLAYAHRSQRLATWRALGEWSQIRRDITDKRAGADQSGDHHMHRMMTLEGLILWLVADQPERAKDEVLRELKMSRHERFSLEDWVLFRTQLEVELYQQGEATGPAFSERWATLEDSTLYRRMDVRIEAAWLKGRLAVAAARTVTDKRLRAAARMAETLAEFPSLEANIYSRLLRAGIALRHNQTGRARELLGEALSSAESLEMGSLAAAIGLRWARMLEGVDRRRMSKQAIDQLRAQGVKNPDRFARMLTGF